ncbi:MFS transporter [Paenibacillus sanfengchensis]|uniref:MFS transporter n=1 Tax=Paenibacillus sanfengchensis TaxID=3119819 RepID=UPI003A5C33FE
MHKKMTPAHPTAMNHPGLMMTAICMGAFISHFTAGVVNVSLPVLVGVFHSSLGTVQWVTTGYLLTIACLLPIMGRLGDRYDLRLIHNCGYLVFTVTSILVAFSANLPVLLMLRVFQAVGAAMFQATNIALSRNTGMATGAAIGLGVLKLTPRTAPLPALGGFRLAFATGFLISIGVLILLSHGVIKQRTKEASS